MQANSPPEPTWLERFFSAPNTMHWEALSARSAPPVWLEQVIPWIDLFSQPKAKVIVLPVFDRDGPCIWYAAATDSTAATALAAELMAFVGPSYSDFRGQPHPCDSGNAIEEALRARFGNLVFRIVPNADDVRPDIVRALASYLGLQRRRPDAPDRTQQPFGKLRADFDRALLAGNEATAAKLLEALCDTGRVNAEQRKYFEVRMLAGLDRQQELARNSSLLKAVMDLSLPPQTIVDLVDALYATFVEDIEEESASSVAAAFEQHIGKHFGALFKERKGVRQANVLKAFFLYEATRQVPDQARCAATIAAFPDDPFGRALLQRWSDQLLAFPESSPAVDPLEAARLAVADENYEIAVTWYKQVLPDQRGYAGLLRCAVEFGAPALTAEVLELFDGAPDAIFAMLGDRDQQRLARLRGTSIHPTPITSASDWLEWAQGVAEHRYGGTALALLNESAVRWPIEDYLREADKCAQLAAIVGNADSPAGAVFRDAFPQFVEFFVHRTSRPVRGFVPLYGMLVKMVTWNGGASPDELELVASLVQVVLSVGPDKQSYADVVEDLGEILSANRAATNIDWALNLAEILATHPAPDSECRLRFFSAVQGLMRESSHRVSSAQRSIIRLLSLDFGCQELLSDWPDPIAAIGANVGTFAGLIAIYTLTEQAGLRARDVLRTMLPNAQIEVNGDSVATDRLRHLAAKADIFVFAWRSSKHQAFFCIKEYRKGRPIHMPVGKGSASILQAALAAAEDAILRRVK
ncbi:protein DpdD [Massilia sp. CMS3.1]|uniref:protein DpdD n=1 Tax=Massilia sp. CMS3.1 TaxID=3373083 RepID=UPI003EE502F3